MGKNTRFMNKKISVAMATYNGSKYIFDQLESIRNQTLPPDEVVICDDGSIDGTIDIIKEYIFSHDLDKTWRLIENKFNLGFIENFVKAISLTNGDLIFLSDQDDIFLKNKFAVMVKYFESHLDALLVNGNYTCIDKNGKPFKTLQMAPYKRRNKIHKLDFREMLYRSSFSGCSMCIKRTLANELIKADRTYCYGHDILLSVIATSKNGDYEIPEVLTLYRSHSDSTTRSWLQGQNLFERRISQKKNELKEYEQLQRMCEINGFTNINYDFINKRRETLKKRIKCLQTKNVLPLIPMLFQKIYPNHTLYGDIYFILKNWRKNIYYEGNMS